MVLMWHGGMRLLLQRRSAARYAAFGSSPLLYQYSTSAPSSSPSPAAAQTHNFAFSGSGFLISYHLGVAQGLHESGFLTPQSKVAGASGGSITALAIAADVDLLEIHDEAKKMVALCREEGTLWKLEARLRVIFNQIFASTSVDVLNKRLTIVTQQVWPKRQTERWDHFDSIADAGNAVIASCYIPFYLARQGATKFRDGFHVDGGLLDLVPDIPGYVKVCAFHATMLRRKDYAISPSLVPNFPYSIWELARASLVPPDAAMLDELFEWGKQSAFLWAAAQKSEEQAK